MQLDATIIGKALDLAYDKAIEGVPGVPGLQSAEELAKDYLNDPMSLEEQVDALIRTQVLKASTSGFVSGLGGVLTLPVAIPANLASILYVQLQMVAAIAYMGGHKNLGTDDRVKTVCYACLCGNAAADVLKGTGILIGKKLTEQAIKNLSYEIIKKINRAVGFRMMTKFGQTGAINLGKVIPLVGGLVGGAFDGTSTYTIGHIAKGLFITRPEVPRHKPSRETDRFDIAKSLEDISGTLFGQHQEQAADTEQRDALDRDDPFLR